MPDPAHLSAAPHKTQADYLHEENCALRRCATAQRSELEFLRRTMLALVARIDSLAQRSRDEYPRLWPGETESPTEGQA